jgi:hypothetical protein
MQTPVIDVRKFTLEEKEQITAAVRLLASHTNREVVKLASGRREEGEK